MSRADDLRDFLLRYQQCALRDTTHRPVAHLRPDLDAALLLPGCQKAGYTYWQPVPWPGDAPPLGAAAQQFHQSIVDYVSLCRFLEMRFMLPAAPASGPLAFLHRRVFETLPNALCAPPEQAFEEAVYLCALGESPLAYCMARTTDAGEPVLLLLDAQDGQAFLRRPLGGEDVALRLTVDRLLPKLIPTFDR